MVEEAKDMNRSITIVHISDIHAGSQYFVTNLMNRAVEEINEIAPDIVVVTGDLANQGFRQEFTTVEAFLSQINCKNKLIVPGNHDSRNVGYVHFEDIFGSRNNVLRFNGVVIVGVDSSEPDLDSGRVGRERTKWALEQFSSKSNDLKIMAMHHHLLPVPRTGRERNVVFDAGDVLEALISNGVDIVLCGHKHVPYVWRIENLVVVNAGTVSSLRVRGRTKPCYNLIKTKGDTVTIYRKYPFGEQVLLAKFLLSGGKYCKWKTIEPRTQDGDGEVP
ncbi:metallophosphoesterase [Candidatus Oleimmundimicrobium sp.]|uniref:metallophosphoesterase family protein n=1 Tax=Candidatus Oleimmundimicrobium sp. TaxID=3060597 RepID=UPI002726884D|nr:metallophosphoesterase [Candidatus Oleimmundimicrobium sp.]MDO8886096.1 metallophosphoesterase [Candidatus Oleimmundimicrobium sp.]